MFAEMFDDTLWIYTAIAGSLLGAAFLFWFKDTRMATWGVAKFDGFLEYLAIRWGWTWLQNDPEAWRKVPKNHQQNRRFGSKTGQIRNT